MNTTTTKRITFADGKQFVVRLSIDSERLSTRMAIKARGNKRGAAAVLQGAVSATVHEIESIESIQKRLDCDRQTAFRHHNKQFERLEKVT